MLRKPLGLFYGWRMVAVGSMMRILGGGLHFYGFTVFFLPLSHDLGLSRAATSLAFSLARAEGAIEGPLAGYLIDRLGPRPIMLTAVILSGLGYIALSTVNSYLAFMLVYLGIISLSFGAGFMHSPMALVNTWFIRSRGVAMGLISASIGMGGALIAPLLAIGVHNWGWRNASVAAGMGFLIVGTPLASTARRSPESMGLLPDGDPPPTSGGASRINAPSKPKGDKETDITLFRAMGTSAFWLVILATTFRTTALSTVMVHFIPIMVWKGLSQQRAASLLSTMGLFSFFSLLSLGWVADRVNKPRMMAWCTAIGTFGLLLLVYSREEWALWLFLPLFTLLESVFPITWATVGDIYGRKNFAKIRGTMSFFYMWGGVVGPIAAGAVYDRIQNYTPMLWALVVLLLISAALYALLSKPWARSLGQR
ncbi:MAG: MFS transporter [Candidatus Binatia bacterium]